ncbi:MAG: hypothetical protein IT437_05145 [Phycisphaerales bacterium]|nr:hypothetical protein [Phycisphaerales bacterium]
MSVETLLVFLNGALAAAAGIGGLFFLRFWRDTHDRLFLALALAFWTLALNWIVLAFATGGDISLVVPHAIRLVAFLIILAGIADKNRRPTK